ncbi:MAG: DUF3488 and transglutaminase-like domain-containing protein [Actinomycetota bacterium]
MSSRQADQRTDNAVTVAAEIFSVLMTAAAVAGFSRVFIDRSWVGSLLTAVVVAHVTVIAVRRLGRGLLLSGVVSLVVMTLQVTWTHYRPTLRAGLPTGTTRDAVDADLSAAWTLFSDVKAPTEPVVGFIVVATLAIWVIAYLADWAAFRLWSPLEAVLPSFAIFVFIAFFGDADDRILLAGLYLAAVIGFQLFHRLIRQAHEVRWLAGTQLPGTSSLMRTGALVSILVVLGAAIAGPALPGAEQEAIFDVDPGSEDNRTRVVISPIVDIRGRLVQQADVEAFSVRASEPSYWRLASLDSFNGQIWGADNKYGKASGTLEDDFRVDADTELLTQEFTIANMGAVWLPAAYEPRRIVASSEENISYEPVSGTLIVGRSLDDSNGLTYTLESAIPTFDPAALAEAPRAYPEDLFDRYVDLPDDFSDRAVGLAFEIVNDAGATNDYEKALALQNFFRDNFDYDLNVGAGHSNARIDQFLDSRIGYCEQFAGAFASMARSLDIPARVAVGFTWGEQDPADPTLFTVRGEHAHAWPEVYIPGSGWVPFEPTPTRGMPNAQAWNGGITPAQEPAGGTPGIVPTPTPGVLPTPTPGEFIPGEGDFQPPVEGPVIGGEAGSDGIPRWLGITALVLVGVAFLSAVYSAIVIGLKKRRTQRRFATASTNSDKVDAVWQETIETLRPLGLTPRPTETSQEFSRRAGMETAPARTPLTHLGQLSVEATYGRGDMSEGAVTAAESHRDEVVDAVNEMTTTSERLKDALDPRPLVKR